MPFIEPSEQVFVKYFGAGWNRLEARSRHDDFDAGLSAATADPLWALARQWQMLELKGDDGGTPIQVELTYEEVSLNRIRLGEQEAENITAPVEVLVEREAFQWDWRLRVRAGQHFERLIRLDPGLSAAGAESLIGRLRADYPIKKPEGEEWVEMDYAARRFVSLMEGRVIDGQALFMSIQKGETPSGVCERLKKQFLNWYSDLYSQGLNPPPAWNPEQLDYEFRLESEDEGLPGPVHAESYRNGRVDWDAFVLERASKKQFKDKRTVHLTPVHVTFPGQPKARWWEFEDRAMDLGALDIAKTDLGKLLLTEFGLLFGDDWFVVPLTGRPNTFLRISRMRVRDCFGQYTDIPSASERATDPLKRWEVFTLAPEDRNGETADFLFLPPVFVLPEESPVVEEVRFARDEDANAVFAIEQIVPNWLGEPTRGFAAHLERGRRWRDARPPESPPAASASEKDAPEEAPTGPVPKIKYVLETEVPSNWIPFIATDALNVQTPQHSVKLQRAAMVSTESQEPRLVLGLSRVLQPDREDSNSRVRWIKEEAVGREGTRVELRRQRMRSPTGETYVWLGRKIGLGKGEARSGLRFDAVLA